MSTMTRWSCGFWVARSYDSAMLADAKAAIFLEAYNHARRLKTLRSLTACEHVLQVWTKEPERFRLNPSHPIPGRSARFIPRASADPAHGARTLGPRPSQCSFYRLKPWRAFCGACK